MGTYSDIEIKVLERLTEVIDNELSSIQLDHADRDRMLYSTCIDDAEKIILTKKEIKKMQKKIAKCPPNIAGYVSALLSPYDFQMHNGDYYDFRNNLCKNFISSYPESIEEIAKEYASVEKVDEEDDMYFEAVLNDDLYEFDKKEIDDFIKFMAIAERLSIFKTILEEVAKENEKPKLDVILDSMKAKADERQSKKANDELSETLDNLKGQFISSLQLYNIIKDITGLEKDALEYLKEDIGWYLWRMKIAQDCFYTEEEFKRAYKKIEKKYTKEKQLELGYLKKTKFFFEVEYVDPEEPIYIDKEKLLYPNEFTSIEDLLEIIKKELGKIELNGEENKTNNTKSDMYLRNSDYSLTGLINTEIYRAITNSTNNKPQEIRIELNAIVNDKKKIKYCEKEAIKLSKKLYKTPDDLERLQAINFLEANKGYKGNFNMLIDNYCKDFTNNLYTSFYNTITEDKAESLVESNSHPNPNTIIEDITKINKLSKLDNSYVIDSIENFKKYMIIAIEAQFYKVTPLVLNSIENRKTPVEKPKTKSKTKHQSFTYKKYNTEQSLLTDLMKALKKRKFIAEDTELANFRKVFSGDIVIIKIVWVGNLSELSYFIKQLHNELKYVENLKQKHWEVTLNCFIQKDGSLYDRKKLRTQKVPSTSKNIDSALNTLK